MNQDKLHINNKDFYWGFTYGKVLKEFNYKNLYLYNDYNYWKNFEIPCSEFAGFKTLTCSFCGPSMNRPVMQVSFDLATIKPMFFEKSYTPYVRHLTKILGKPHNISKPKLLRHNPSDQVIYNCKWWLGDIKVSLSVFGGIRTRKEGIYSAGLYFDWLNETQTAKPYLKEFLTIESELLEDLVELRTIKMNRKLSPFYKVHYELDNPHQALENKEIRTAQLVLYKENTFRTPTYISNELTDFEIILFKSQKANHWCIGNKWDFTPINESSSLKYINLKSDRGLGDSTVLIIGSLSFNDEENSMVLNELSLMVEKLTGRQFEKSMARSD